MNLNSRQSLISRLRRGKATRHRFVESHLAKNIAHQIRAIRDKLGWSQEKLATESGMNQNAISRLESADYGRYTLSTLKRLAEAMDVALIVRFVPFSELVDWVSGTPRVIEGLGTRALSVDCFDREEDDGIFVSPEISPSPTQRSGYTAIRQYTDSTERMVESSAIAKGWMEAYLSPREDSLRVIGSGPIMNPKNLPSEAVMRFPGSLNAELASRTDRDHMREA